MAERTGGLSPKDVGLQIVGQILNSYDSSGIDRVLFRRVKEPVVRQALIRDIDRMVDDVDNNRFALGALLTTIGIDELSDKARSSLSPVTMGGDFTIEPFGDEMFLCGDGERYLVDSFKRDAIMLINDVLLMKFVERNVALSLENTVTPSGQVFIAGNFYSRSRGQNELGDYLRGLSMRGHTHTSLLQARWTLLRPIDLEGWNSNGKSLLERAREIAGSLPEEFGPTVNIRGRTRPRRDLFPRYGQTISQV